MSKASDTPWKSHTKNDLIIEVWEALDCESVGSRELEQIQQALHEQFGAGGAASPAAIARVVADEGAALRHPEVFDCDLRWRQQELTGRSPGETLDFSGLSAAFASLVTIETKRLAAEADVTMQNELRQLVAAAREDSLLRAGSKIMAAGEREEANEISQWLLIWLQAPDLFSDWLDLRRRSPEFRRKFPHAEL
jgi:hypothetical protein